MRRLVDRLLRLRCPHHGRFCYGRDCCCRDRHWRGLGFDEEIRNVSVRLTADTSRFEEAMADLQESLRRQRYTARLARERTHARLFLLDLTEQAWARYGCWPGGDPR